MSQLAARDDVPAMLHATLFIYLLNFIKKKTYAGYIACLLIDKFDAHASTQELNCINLKVCTGINGVNIVIFMMMLI